MEEDFDVLALVQQYLHEHGYIKALEELEEDT